MANAAINKQLLETILDGQGIKNTHFFNGRLLTAEDLKTEQTANRSQHEQLGQAIGAGIVNGLEVSLVADGSDGAPPVVTVTAGLALNRKGQAVALSSDIQLALNRQNDPLPVEAGLFGECSPPKTGIIPRDKGAYILVATPASGLRELAPVRGFSDGKVINCASRYAQEGIKFRLEELIIPELTAVSQTTCDAVIELMTKSDAASLSKLRNWLAHLCFGTEELAGFLQDPFGRVSAKSANQNYGALDALRNKGQLTDCDIPLAMMYWTPGGVKFLDMWSVRRRLTQTIRTNYLSLPLNERRLTESEAIFQQFEEHINNLVEFRSKLSDEALSLVQAKNYFRYLPSVSLLPLANSQKRRGFNLLNFTSELTIRDRLTIQVMTFPDRIYLEGAKLEQLISKSLIYPPINLLHNELIWSYLVRENIQAIDDAASNSPQSYLVLANGQIPFEGDAKFDLNYWNYSNFR
ncbi:MAG: hypothetical protein IPN42_02520 [Methylococcaceae bacterium]|nr:hypothetical protein [Methylococcaceae bacterium]